ncbi:hypothetical protein EI546_01155 [Aequorivita sp. H23M31]|uniref:Uncharacterized protein n=1 Tax=Aequorivita ciconiae TaxID=2494375 RepID=A0A410FZJ2_9FLAO|nr:hypothetical protein [Aequorivita sp. H23M31]QAA80420.1 hypothetical protein EI546_01155 [Aequorivita sp. H23M31]
MGKNFDLDFDFDFDFDLDFDFDSDSDFDSDFDFDFPLIVPQAKPRKVFNHGGSKKSYFEKPFEKPNFHLKSPFLMIIKNFFIWYLFKFIFLNFVG